MSLIVRADEQRERWKKEKKTSNYKEEKTCMNLKKNGKMSPASSHSGSLFYI